MPKKKITKDVAPAIETKVLSDNEIEKAVEFINEKANETVYKGSIEIGQFILEKFYDNDINAATSRSPQKQASYKKLCERQDLAVHPTSLAKMVRVASQEWYFIENKIDVSGLSYTHMAELVKLKNGKAKIDIVKKCKKANWTTRQLEKEIRIIAKEISIPTKYPPTIAIKQAVAKIESFSGDAILKKIPEVESLKKMRPSTRKMIMTNISKIMDESKAGKNQLDEILAKCSTLIEKIDEFGKS